VSLGALEQARQPRAAPAYTRRTRDSLAADQIFLLAEPMNRRSLTIPL
jgi:hypothetical protein